MTNPTSNFGWQMPTPTDLVTDLPADFEVFGQAVDTSMADLRGGTTGQILSKTTNADMDFTWIANDQGDITAVNVTSPITGGGSSGAVTIGINAATTSVVGAVQLSDSTSTTSSVLASTPTATKAAYDLAAAAIPKSTVTTAGDVIYATGSAAVTRLGIGSTGNVLTVTGGVPVWAAPAGGGGMTQLASGSLTGSTVSLTSISQSYNNLVLIGNAITPSSSGDAVALQVNGTGNNNFYASTLIDTTLSIGSANQHCGLCVGSGTLAQYFTATIFNYTSANAKQFQTQGYTVAGSNGKRTNWGTIIGTGAITSLQMNIASSFSAGTYILYGVK